MSQHSNLPQTDNKSDLVLFDRNGKEILRVCNGEIMVTKPDGSVLICKQEVGIELADGSMWSPNKGLDLAICQICRRPSYDWLGRSQAGHGLCRQGAAQNCPACGMLTCPSHRRPMPDGRVLCVDCAGKASGLLGFLSNMLGG